MNVWLEKEEDGETGVRKKKIQKKKDEWEENVKINVSEKLKKNEGMLRSWLWRFQREKERG